VKNIEEKVEVGSHILKKGYEGVDEISPKTNQLWATKLRNF